MRASTAVLCTLLLAGCGPAGGPGEETAEAVEQAAPASEFEAATVPDGDLAGEQLFLACAGCHSLREGAPHKVGPNLHDIAGQPAGTLPGYAYSPALVAAGQEQGLVWDKGSLMAWVMQTEGMVPGTWMLYYNTLSAAEVQRLVDYILGETG